MKNLLYLLIVALLAGMFGCSAGGQQVVQDRPYLVKASVQILTVEYLKLYPQRLGKMDENVLLIRNLVMANEVVNMDELARKLQNTLASDSSLDPAEIIIASQLAEALAYEGKTILEAQGYGADALLADPAVREIALQTLQWILDAHNLVEATRKN